MKPSERRKARHCATQAIYQWQMTQANVGDIEEQFKIDQDTKGVDLSYFRDLLFGVAVHNRFHKFVRLGGRQYPQRVG